MDRSGKHTLATVGVVVVACLVAILIIRLDVPPPLKKQRLILDTLGCQAAKKLGLQAKAVDSDICEIEDNLSVGLVWVTFDKGKIDRARVVAVQR